MAHEPLSLAAVVVDEFDITGSANFLGLTLSAELLDRTTFSNTTRIYRGGLKDVEGAVRGFYDTGESGDPDSALHDRVGGGDVVTSLIAKREVGQRAFLVKTTGAVYEIGGEHGQLMPFSLDLKGAGDLVRGVLAADETAEATSSAGTAIQLGAVGEGQRIYAALHVLSASGGSPTLDVVVESDDSSGMGSATTRISFAQATDVGSEWASAAGEITDDYWRISWTIGGSTPAFDFVVTIGIL